ncbi:MAG: ABC transporter permease, partial [Comamonas sp.]|nr:ABC transporter permease [Comamonas sp.]
MNTTALPLPSSRQTTADLRQQLRSTERKHNLRAFSLTLPLLGFLFMVFMLPLASLLTRAVENPEVADTLSHTGQA